MADEVLGNLYEVITLIAIEDFTSVLQPNESLFWHENPQGVSIEPDLTIGIDKDHPRLILQISHTNAERASEKKFWRNIGEFVDARIALGTSTAIANIVFDSGQKRNLTVASEAIFDGFFEADRTSYGQDLLDFAAGLVPTITGRNIPISDRPDFLRQVLRNQINSRQLVGEFAQDLEITLSTSSRFTHGWYSAFQQVRSLRPTTFHTPPSRATSIRRGLGRLLPIGSEEELRQIIEATRSNQRLNLPEYLYILRLATRSIVGGLINDREILGLLNLISTDSIVELWSTAKAASNSLRQACNSIANNSDFQHFHSFVSNSFSQLSTASSLELALSDCFNNPNYILGVDVGILNPTLYGVWLFDYLMVIIKAHSGNQQGYGYTRLGRESGFRQIAATPGFIISPFIQRNKPLKADILTGIARALSNRLTSIGASWIANNQDRISEYYLRGLFEDKIYKISAFDPLKWLMTSAIQDYEEVLEHPTGLTDIIGGRYATCSVIAVSNTIIFWQSASAGHGNDKSKELMGRVAMLRVTGDVAASDFNLRNGIEKALIMIDGDWTDRHIQDLCRAGFDGVFYPDEANQLVAAIV